MLCNIEKYQVKKMPDIFLKKIQKNIFGLLINKNL